ncbi:hypothetical protein Cgig2_016496 [Carnegiea gigantea]|uniref:Uncharacterized protein n=1 Tax=Carnegiea gigantea TaxID=171969 RepID=A0A9Q1JN27_9CARY|nr:hypothetical protein Cgig2_016496 [Carnegiea gigantea]
MELVNREERQRGLRETESESICEVGGWLRFSLSSALEYFSPFAARVAASQDSNRIKFVLGETASPSVPLTIAECDDAQFEYLCRDTCQKNANDLHLLVPNLRSLRSSCGLDNLSPLLAIQLTYFPLGHGFSIGLAYHRVVSDQRTFNYFMHSWASLCKHGELPPGLEPTFDRAVVLDPNGLEPILLNRFWESVPGSIIPAPATMCLGLVRSTFVMGPADIAKAQQWILAECERKNRPYPVLLSPYVVTCAFIWACLVRAQSEGLAQTRIPKGPMYFGFIAGGITRLRYRVPGNYFGNCVAFGRAIAQREELLGNDGVLVAADAIGQAIKKLNRDVLDEAGNWISDWEPIVGSDLHVNMVGSPKVDLYEVDFGWGKPKKIEENSIDVMRGISLTESREVKGGIEIGMALPKSTMDAFSCLFTRGLLDFSF